jgi:hypothetical protein
MSSPCDFLEKIAWKGCVIRFGFDTTHDTVCAIAGTHGVAGKLAGVLDVDPAELLKLPMSKPERGKRKQF